MVAPLRARAAASPGGRVPVGADVVLTTSVKATRPSAST